MAEPEPDRVATRVGEHIVLPGMVSAHSHAFQRGLRGRTQRGGRGTFWSWRGLMYRFANGIDPDSIYALSRHAYAELALHGVTHVGEFHYVHHQPDGTPYADRIAMADAVIRAARDVGIRITLLRVLYERAGWGRAIEDGQRRFCDGADDAIRDADALESRWADDACVNVGLAPHSVRAVSADSLKALAREASRREWPLHIHVGEQRREVQECLAEHGCRPVELLAEQGVLSERFVGVHATHLSPSEISLLAERWVCVCRTTERDLGDGSPDLAALRARSARFCVGVDSHARSDPFEELRALELDERVRTEARNAFANGTELLRWGSDPTPLGTARSTDAIELDAHDPTLAGSDDDTLDDAIAFGAGGRTVRQVVVDGKPVVDGGVLPDRDAIRVAFDHAVRELA